MSNLIETKKRAKAKKPRFVRQDEFRFTRLKAKWRKPRGIHSKLRRRKAGKRAVVKTGYKTPRDLQGCNTQGLKLVVVATIKEIEALDKSKHSAIIARAVGKRKRVELLTAAEKNGVQVYNIKDVASYKKTVANELAARKKMRAQRSQSKKKAEPKDEKEQKEKTAAKVAPEKRTENASKDTEEQKNDSKKKAERNEKDEERRKAEKIMIHK
jgi:large subunit ribosomal protein L32e